MYLDPAHIEEHKGNEPVLIISDKEGIIQFVSPNCMDIIGFDPDNICFKQHYLDLFSARSKEVIEHNVGEAKKRNKKETGYFSVKLNHNAIASEIELNINLLSDKQAFFKGILAEIKVRNLHSGSEGAYKKLLDNIPLGIYRTTIDGELVYVNQSLLDLFHYKNNKELGKKNKRIFVDKNYRASKINEWIEKGSYSTEFKAYTKEGEIICVKDEGKAFKDKNGAVIYFDGVLEDICKQKESEAKMEELNLSKDKFLSIISHDLKAPFGQFINATELILEKIDEFDIEQIEKLVRLLNEQAVKSYKLLENLLEWSRNQKGLIEFNPQPVSLYSLVNEVIDNLGQLAMDKSIVINSSIKKGLFIYADNYMLSTIMRNLISNAIKFTDIKGQINISSRYVLAKDDFGNKLLEISVSDTGVGIRKEDIAKLFRIDTAFSSKGTKKESGTGLGLILCKDFVEKHGGKIWVESEENKGSTFKFTLP